MKNNIFLTMCFSFLSVFLFAGDTPTIEASDITGAAQATVGMALVSTEQGRAAYERFADKLRSGKDPIANPMITPVLLRMEATLSAESNTYEFNIIKAQGNGDKSTENKLDKNEMAYIVGLGLGVAKYDAAGANPGNAVVYPYAPKYIFDTAASGGAKSESAALETIWNGRLNIAVDQTTLLKNFNTGLLRHVPTEQGSASTNSNSGGSVEELGIYMIQPGLILTAEDQIDVTLKLGEGDRTAIEGTSSVNTVIFHAYGFLYTGKGKAGYTL